MRGRTLVLDGAMGTMIQRCGLSEADFHGAGLPGGTDLKGDNECLNLTRPDIIREIHSGYIEAGADIITTNTFSANSIAQAANGCQAFAGEMARKGAMAARKAADKAGRKVWVAGSMGPTGKSLTLAQDLDRPTWREYGFDQMAEAYGVQARALIDGGADLLLLETCFDALNTKAAIYAIASLEEAVPVIISVSASDRSGRTLTGQTLEAFYTSVRHCPGLLAFGINCSLGAEDMIPLVEEIASFSPLPLICYPNAGLPNEMGAYDETPAQMASAMRRMVSSCHPSIIGGCCGTTPEHIRELAAIAAESGAQGRVAATAEGAGPSDGGAAASKAGARNTVSGLETVHIDLRLNNFTNIGERTNVAGSRKFARLIAAHDYDSALQVAADQIENGAGIIDINMDDAMLDSRAEMEAFVRCTQNDPAVAKAALMIDSSHWETIVAGLKNAQGKCIVNSISLKEGEAEFLRKALEIKRLGAAMVVMAFDGEGQATTFSRKVGICSRAYKLLTDNGIAPNDIIFDCNVLSIGTGMAEHARYAVDFIEAVRWIKANLPGALTSGGISNLSFAFRGNNPVREAMHSVFLYHAVKAGLDMGIVNPGMLQVYDSIDPELLRRTEDVILDRSPQATDALIDLAQSLAAAKSEGKPQAETATQAVTDPDERLRQALVKGDASTVREDALKSMELHGAAVDVIQGPLMDGMATVGELFGGGKMFLPQVVKSAKVMREAVAALEPYMKGSSDTSAKSRPKVVQATVKGDVHDIGKNITGIVLTCNGFDVTDLGVMVDRDVILDTARRIGADIVAVSGLITPSLYQMEELCREMTRRGMTTPLFVGGATTSALHTAVKLAPLYAHVFYGADASACAVDAKRCMMDREGFEAERHAGQERLRELYRGRPEKKASDEAAGYPEGDYLHEGEYSFTDIPCMEVPVDGLVPYMDWRMFLATWGFKYGEALPQSGEVPKTLEEGRRTLGQLSGRLSVRLSVRFFQATSDGDDILLCTEGPSEGAAGGGGKLRLPMLRQEDGRRRSLSDFVPPPSMGFTGPMGIFALSVHEEDSREGCDCEACRKDYTSMMERSVRVCLAEACSAWLDSWLKERIHRDGITISKPAAGYASCPDHTLKRDILALLPESGKLGISFTESYAMIPDASICGFIFAHAHAGYPEIRHVSREALGRYAMRRGFSPQETERFLGHLL